MCFGSVFIRVIEKPGGHFVNILNKFEADADANL